MVALPAPSLLDISRFGTPQPPLHVVLDDRHNHKSQDSNFSTHELLYANGLAAYCVDFPGTGTSLCMPESCAIYTVQKIDTCYSIVEEHKYAFTVTQLVFWNANSDQGPVS
ncbi:hypothetical protein BDW59DRAFT_158988 [Aspergillus cavernicola]|uniref:LysM domain-containing protein n=1 Tax=Aspergillus cavernicola TaxID=176166 RepID=A0ABR4INT5_9EURO